MLPPPYKYKGFGVFTTLLTLGSVLGMMGVAEGAVFNATFSSTVSSLFSQGVDNVTVGDTFLGTVALDNGGSSIENQTWEVSDVVSITFDFGNGNHRTVFNNTTTSTSGKFTTNALGVLTAVPNWRNSSANDDFLETNSSQNPRLWALSGVNSIYATQDINGAFIGSVFINNVEGNNVASNWSIAPAPSVTTPEPSLMLGLIGVGAVLLSGKGKNKK